MTDDRWDAETDRLLARTSELATDYLRTLPTRPVRERATLQELRAALGGRLSAHGEPSLALIEELARIGDAGAVAQGGPRFFGFVIGGALPVTLAADWLVSTWDQNSGLYVISPAVSVAEETAARWLLDLLHLPDTASVGFTTGCQMAHFTALAAARRAVLLRHGWDVEADGLQGAPPVRVIVGDEVHVTVPIALQMLGLGSHNMIRVAADEQGRMRADALREVMAQGDGPTIVSAQIGNVNTGAFDPIDAIADLLAEHPGTWLHLDGAMGLWAAASGTAELSAFAKGFERADSWATDAHKWLNVPYDSGIVIVNDPDAHRAAMMLQAAYLVTTKDARDNSDWVPEFSRRGRGFPVYVALRALGSAGVTDLIDRCCTLARRMAERLATDGGSGVTILNDVVLNQVLVRFDDDDETTRAVVRRVQEDGTCWLGGSTWQSKAVMRISVSNWATREADADVSVDAILRCYTAERDPKTFVRG